MTNKGFKEATAVKLIIAYCISYISVCSYDIEIIWLFFSAYVRQTVCDLKCHYILSSV